MNFKSIFFYLGLLCFPISFLSFINILYSNYFDYFLSLETYITTLIVSLVIGLIFYFLGKNSNKKMNFNEQISLIILTYFIISLIISIPYYFSNYQISFIDSIFESLSGITSTGFSIFENIKYIDPTLILWRSSSQWIGGFYFLLFLVIIFSKQEFQFKLNNLTFSGDGGIKTETHTKTLILKIFLLYLITSITIFFILNLSGVRLFNALNLSMTLVSTGGFLPTNSLSQIITNQTQQISLAICLLIPLMNIFIFINFFNKRNLINNHREDYALIFLIALLSTILIFTSNQLDLNEILINVISSVGNSGITISKTQKDISLYFLILTLIGGSLISTTSGIKFLRLYILIKASISEVLKLVRPNNVINQSIMGTEMKIDNDNIRAAFLIFICFFISTFILSGLLIIDDIGFETSFKLSILTLTNTVNSNLFDLNLDNFNRLLTSTKISLILFMIIGKIELISLLIVIRKIIFKN